MKRRSAIEPIIGSFQTDHRPGRNDLKAGQSNEIDVIRVVTDYEVKPLVSLEALAN